MYVRECQHLFLVLLLCTSIIKKLFRETSIIYHLFVFLLSIVHYLYLMMLHTQCQHIFQINRVIGYRSL